MDILGINPERPAPPPTNLVVVDYDRWRYHVVMYECLSEAVEKEKRIGSATVPIQGKTLRRRGGGPVAQRRGKQADQEIADMCSLLVKARVVTVAASELMTKRELRAATKDLRRRLEASAGIGVGMEEEGT